MNKLIYLVIFSFFSTGIYAQMKDLVQYVNTLQGTDSHFGLSYEIHILLQVCLMPCIRGLPKQGKMEKAGNINMQ